MPRVTEDAVLAIIDTELTPEEVTPFLTSASRLIDDLLAGEGYGDELLEEIEKWLAAHFVAIRDPRVKSEKTGEGSASYHGSSGEGLAATPYGQQVKILDYRGVFANLDAGKGDGEVKALA